MDFVSRAPDFGAHKLFSTSKRLTLAVEIFSFLHLGYQFKKLYSNIQLIPLVWCVCSSLKQWVLQQKMTWGKTVLIFPECYPAILLIRLYWCFKNSRREWNGKNNLHPTPTSRVLTAESHFPCSSPQPDVFHTSAHLTIASDHTWFQGDEGDYYYFFICPF